MCSATVNSHHAAGFTTVESLVALLLFAIGVLGSVGTVGLATRAMGAGTSAAAAARRMAEVGDSLAAAALAAGGSCAAIVTGSAGSRHGVTLSWRGTDAAGGRLVELTANWAGLRGIRADTVTGFVPCR